MTVDFNNFTYKTNPCFSNVPVAAVVSAGRFDYFDQKMGAGFTISVKSVTAGSLGAGSRQAVVVLTCDFPIGGTAAAYLFDIHGNAATLLGKVADANWGADWGAGPDSIHLKFASGTLSVTDCANTDCTANALTTYALRGGKLTKLSSKTMPAN
jgi:hypothetical protein